MTKDNQKALQALLIVIVSCIFWGLYSYVFDCVYNFKYAIQSPEYFPAYVVWYTLMRPHVIVPLIILYRLLSRKSPSPLLKALAMLLVVLIAGVLGKLLGKDDYNFSIHTRAYKNLFVYPLAALSTFLLYEWILWRNKKKEIQSDS